MGFYSSIIKYRKSSKEPRKRGIISQKNILGLGSHLRVAAYLAAAKAIPTVCFLLLIGIGVSMFKNNRYIVFEVIEKTFRKSVKKENDKKCSQT